MKALQILPLLAVSWLIYAVLTLGQIGVAGTPWVFADIYTVALPSDDAWIIRGGDVFLVASIGFLFVELLRATRTDTSTLANHFFSFVLFLACLFPFIFMKGFGNSYFFLFMTMTFLDAMAGMVITTVTARRDFSVTDGVGGN
ncbi:MAG: hypothetical protein EVA70_05725 [Parvularculaceae bacterium]|nr:MAG: hypothetical protein EVA70_05725 [Parvularculaceae bacterium]